MKKSILFTVLAIFAGMSVSWSQSLPGSPPRGVDCEDGPGNPIAGKSYNYQASATPSGGDYLFWATKDPDFISTAAGVTTTNINTMLLSPTTTPPGTDLLETSANYANPDPQDYVSITWSDAILNGTDPATSPTFVATYYEAPTTGCADNFRVWSIDPIVAFTVDIKNIEDLTGNILAYDAAEDQCIDNVRGATYVGTAMQYNFGWDTMYYEVVAANFTNSWTPTFTITGLHTVQTAVVTWTYDNPTLWGPATVWNDATETVYTTETNTDQGVSIYVRMIITNNNYEGNNDRNITLAVDGQNSVGDWDIVNNTPTDPGPLCDPATVADQYDIAMQTQKARPTLTPVDPPAFVGGNEQN